MPWRSAYSIRSTTTARCSARHPPRAEDRVDLLAQQRRRHHTRAPEPQHAERHHTIERQRARPERARIARRRARTPHRTRPSPCSGMLRAGPEPCAGGCAAGRSASARTRQPVPSGPERGSAGVGGSPISSRISGKRSRTQSFATRSNESVIRSTARGSRACGPSVRVEVVQATRLETMRREMARVRGGEARERVADSERLAGPSPRSGAIVVGGHQEGVGSARGSEPESGPRRPLSSGRCARHTPKPARVGAGGTRPSRSAGRRRARETRDSAQGGPCTGSSGSDSDRTDAAGAVLGQRERVPERAAAQSQPLIARSASRTRSASDTCTS